MGDPRSFRRTFKGPRHPWKKERIEAERVIVRSYGLKNKREVYQMNSLLKKFRDLAKKLIAAAGVQADRERAQLLDRLVRLGLVKPGAKLDDVLGLSLDNIMERRLQTVLVRKGLAKSMRQARQFVVHTHVMVGGRVLSRPSYLVSVEEESALVFHPQSLLANPEHPVRVVKPVEKPVIEKTGKVSA